MAKKPTPPFSKIPRVPLRQVSRPALDIIVPFHGKYEYVMRCCESILKCTPNQPYSIYLIDDASPNQGFIKTMITKRIGGGQLDEQLGFAGALFQAYNETKSPWIVIMHSDVVVRDIYWLLHMQRTMESLKGKGVKLVTAMTNNPGTAASFDERMICNSPEEIEDTEDVIVDKACPLFCALMHRELFKKIRGFLKQYPLAWYEDEELFWRMKHFGYKQAICRTAWVHHEGGATIKDLWKQDANSKQIMENNYNLCIQDIRPYVKVG